MNDNDLKNLVEKEWNNFHLEYLEVARKEYLKRSFKNDSRDEEPEPQEESDVKNRYPVLRKIARIYSVLAWIIGIVGGLFPFQQYSEHDDPGLLIASLVVVALLVLGFLAASELIKVFIDIEKNTRKVNE